MIFIAFLNFTALQLLNGQELLTGFKPEQMQALVGLFFNMHTSEHTMLFHGIGLALFFYLLFKAKNIPKILAVFGIISYLLLFIYALINILASGYSSMLIIQIICYTPSCICEVIIGLWFLTKGINFQ